ncbi:hypothetical protein K7X08_034932 [Anisodus acutangulus]|uniref:Uncharacterized protein n=1 Tax=Anisodus acutangulus TaxID=402998 RepID=A0A9Q1LJP9_9SOLA|nr:hypothetical protein K7X08_034932 [Anisodus acutangulus]
MLLHLGSKSVLVASSAEATSDILKTHDLVYSNRCKSSIADGLLCGSKDVAYSPYDEYWRQIRSVTVLHLLRNKRVQSYRDVREEETVAIGRTYNEGESGIDVKALLEELLALLEIQKGNETGFPIQRDSLKAILLDSFIDGTDTTLEWVMTELLRHPRVLEKLQDKVRQ